MNYAEKEAMRTRVTVGKDGHIDVPRVDLPEGTEAEVVVVVKFAHEVKETLSLLELRGMGKGVFGTPEEADAYLRAERDAWDS
jgi:hypothetical protein